MRLFARSFVVLLPAFLAGCNRQDTDALARIGQKLTTLSVEQGDTLREKYQVSWSVLPGLKEKVQQRISWDKALTNAKIDIVVNGKEVELKGSIVNDEQRRQAITLAENTSGVDKVVDSLQLAP